MHFQPSPTLILGNVPLSPSHMPCTGWVWDAPALWLLGCIHPRALQKPDLDLLCPQGNVFPCPSLSPLISSLLKPNYPESCPLLLILQALALGCALCPQRLQPTQITINCCLGGFFIISFYFIVVPDDFFHRGLPGHGSTRSRVLVEMSGERSNPSPAVLMPVFP